MRLSPNAFLGIIFALIPSTLFAQGYTQDFNSTPADWTFDSPVGGVSWAVDATPSTFPNRVSRSGNSLNYNNGTDYSGNNKGKATSPAISLSGLTNPVLKFWCNYHTETRGIDFDKRTLQILNSDGTQILATWQMGTEGYTFDPAGGYVGQGTGPCKDAYLDEFDQPINTWHQHKIYLDPAWGTIRVRFIFDSVDDRRNNYSGWAIDDLTVGSHPNPLPAGWPDLFPDNITSDGDGRELDICSRSSNTLSWSWGTCNLGSPGIHCIVGDHPKSIIDKSDLEWSAAHNHLHFSQFADFSIWEMQPGIGFTKKIRSQKRSFYLTDIDSMGSSPNMDRSYPTYGETWYGISYNWQDVYGLGTTGQNANVSSLTTGKAYYLIGIADPFNRLRELTNSNQVDQIHFTLPSSGSVSILDHTNPYPQTTTALTISAAVPGFFNGAYSLHVIGTGFNTSMFPFIYDIGTTSLEAPFYTLVSSTEMWITVPQGITNPATLDILQSSGQVASARITAGPVIACKSSTMDDDSLNGTTGNADGYINPGETIGLTIKATNFGNQTATGVTGTLSLASADSSVTILQNQLSFGDIAAGADSQAAAQFTFSLLASTVTPHPIQFVLTFKDSANKTWTSNLSYTAYTSSHISGKVSKVTGGDPIAGATVSYKGPLTGSVKTQADGTYSFFALDGTYSVSAKATGFVSSSSKSVKVPPDAPSVNFALGISDINVTPPSASGTADMGLSTTTPITIQNLGDVTLTYKFKATDYKVMNSDMVGGPVYSWIDISSTGTNISGLGDDSNVGPINIGFSFPFYDQNFSTLRLCSNGWLSFTDTATTYTNYNVPNTAVPKNIIAFLWDDLIFQSGSAAYYKLVDPNTFVIEFKNVSFYEDKSKTVTCEVILKSDGSILLQYQTIGITNECTVGIQDSTQTKAVSVVHNGNYLHNAMAIRFTNGFGAPWLSASPTSGSIAAGKSVPITLSFNSMSLAAGTYNATMGITSNDPDEPLVNVPVTFTVVYNPPAAPSNLTVQVAGITQVNLNWTDNSSNETSFKVERKVGASGAFVEIGSVAAGVTTYNDTGAASGVENFYRVRSANGSGYSSYSNVSSGTTPGPRAPSTLSGVVISQTQINLTWSDDSTNETGFKLERAQGQAGTYAQIALLGAGVTSYNDTGLTANTEYLYRIRSYNAEGDSNYSLPISKTTLPNPPGAPANLNANVVSYSNINLTWTDQATNETGFKIERQTGAGAFAEIATVGVNSTGYTDTTAAPLTQYTYRIRAYNTGGFSDYATSSAVNTPANSSPTVSITSPQTKASFLSGANLLITAVANDSDGTITKVEFYEGGNLIGTDFTSPFTTTWNNITVGSHDLMAKAIDNLGATTTTAIVKINVEPVYEGTLAAGLNHSLALKNDGTVWSWGLNNRGQLGLGNTNNSLVPMNLSGLSNVMMVSAGDYHSSAVTTDHSLWTWGYNASGQIGKGSSGGSQLLPYKVTVLTNSVDRVACGGNHTVIEKTDGTVWTFGYGGYGQLGIGTNSSKSLPQLAFASNCIDIAAGEGHTVALQNNGLVWAWGLNSKGQLGNGTTNNVWSPIQVAGLSNIVQVAAGHSHTLALKSDGTVWSWGYNAFGGLGNGTYTNCYRPVQVKGLSNIVVIAGGKYHSMALRSDGAALTWGYNVYGQLGNGSNSSRSTPVLVTGSRFYNSLGNGSAHHTLALETNGVVWSWGQNTYGELGVGTTNHMNSPAQISGLDLIP